MKIQRVERCRYVVTDAESGRWWSVYLDGQEQVVVTDGGCALNPRSGYGLVLVSMVTSAVESATASRRTQRDDGGRHDPNAA